MLRGGADGVCAGELSGIHIPDVEDEVIRDVCRGRTDAVDERSRTKKQLLSFMLRNGYRYKGTAHWTEGHMRYLRFASAGTPGGFESPGSRAPVIGRGTSPPEPARLFEGACFHSYMKK